MKLLNTDSDLIEVDPTKIKKMQPTKYSDGLNDYHGTRLFMEDGKEIIVQEFISEIQLMSLENDTINK